MQTDETTPLRSGLQATAGAVVGCMLGDISMEGLRQTPRLSRRQIAPAEAAVACLSWTIFMSLREPFAALNVALAFVGPRTYKPREVGIARKQMKHWLIGQCGIVAIEKTGPVLCAHHALQSEKRARLVMCQPRSLVAGEVTAGAQTRASSGWEISTTESTPHARAELLVAVREDQLLQVFHLVFRQLHGGSRLDRHTGAGIDVTAAPVMDLNRDASFAREGTNSANRRHNGLKRNALRTLGPAFDGQPGKLHRNAIASGKRSQTGSGLDRQRYRDIAVGDDTGLGIERHWLWHRLTHREAPKSADQPRGNPAVASGTYGTGRRS